MSPLTLSGPEKSDRSRLTFIEQIVFAFYAAVFGLWVFDLNEADTALITSADERLIGGLTWLGALLGVVLGAFMLRYSARTRAEMSTRRVLIAAMLVLPTFGTFYAVILNHAAWRTANIIAFSKISGPITQAQFPIVSYRMSKSRPIVSIDTQGEERPIPISPTDYALLEAAHHPSRYCLVLNRQQAGSAVRVFRPRDLSSGGVRGLGAMKPCARLE